jgi:hypothetical protein
LRAAISVSIAGLIQIAGPFLDPWRETDRAAQRARRSDKQRARLDELDAIEARTDAEEIEYLTLWRFTDHADRDRAHRRGEADPNGQLNGQRSPGHHDGVPGAVLTDAPTRRSPALITPPRPQATATALQADAPDNSSLSGHG